MFSQTRQMVRQWSDRMAAVAGHVERSPAPYLENRPAVRPSFPPALPTRSVPAPLRRRWRRSRAVRITMRMRNRRERWKRTHPNMNRVLSGILIALALLLVMGSVGGSAYAYSYYQSQLPRLQALAKQTISQSTRIYDRDGTLLYEVYNTSYNSASPPGRRTPVSYNDIPPVLRDAQVDIEDSTFWTNSGVDPVGIIRSMVGFASSASVQGGGSTIAQQVIKNLSGDAQVSLARKIPEAALAIGLTQQYPKWKILEMYFNIAPYGTQDLGIEAAAEEYFHLMPQCTTGFQCTPGIKFLNKNLDNCQEVDKMKCPDDYTLGLARATVLAGIPNNPTLYNPTNSAYIPYVLDRQKLVLQRMVQLQTRVDGLGVVTPEIATQVENLTAQMKFYQYSDKKNSPHFVDWIINKLETILGNGDPENGAYAFITGGFNIRTTLDLNLENYVENVVQHHLSADLSATKYGEPLDSDAHNVHDAAVVVMNAHTGEILAMDGSANYNDPTSDPRINGQYNAADPPASGNGAPPGRGPGSSFKPFVYATAFQMGWYPGMIIPDYHTNFPQSGQGAGAPAAQTEAESGDLGTYMYAVPDFSFSPTWNHATHYDPAAGIFDAASVTARKALQESLNVGAIKAMKFAGPDNVLNMVHRLGLTEETNQGISWALGTENATVLQMTDAYQTFANGGQRIPSQGILGIWDNYGNALYQYDPAHPQTIQVMSAQIAFLMTSVLRDEPSRINEFGSYHTLSFGDIEPACIYQQACDYQVAAKTGTTDNFQDTWTMGYTPDVVVGTWTGNANGNDMQNILGISGAGTIWHSVIKAASGYCNIQDNTNPSLGYDDRVACPYTADNATAFVQELGINADRTFTQPTGVTQISTSNTDGLAGGGNYDYALDNEAPQQSDGITNTRNNNNGNGH